MGMNEGRREKVNKRQEEKEKDGNNERIENEREGAPDNGDEAGKRKKEGKTDDGE